MLDRLFSHPASIVLLVVLLVVLLGSKRLPDVARSLGRSTRILKSEVDEMRRESDTGTPMRRESDTGTDTDATTRRESNETPIAPSRHEGTRE